jgi:hypothetical protein
LFGVVEKALEPFWYNFSTMKTWQKIILAGFVVLILGTASLALPPVQDRVFYHAGQLRIRVQYALFPPEDEIFTPNLQVAQIVEATLTQMAQAVTPTFTPPPPTDTPTPLPPDEPTLTPVPPTPTATPLPVSVFINNVPYVDQHYGFNNCAPANLTMALHFWGWQGTRDEVTRSLKPFERDKNVMPYEMAEFVNGQTDLRAVQRFGGSLEVLRRLVSGGFPVVVERGVYLRDLTGKVSWMGHYQTVNGYNDDKQIFQVKDSYEKGGELLSVPYDDMIRGWRSFNYAFIVIFPPEREEELLTLLGPYADETTANQIAAQTASDEMYLTQGQDQFFAYYNRGTSLVWLQDYANAAQVYDEAFRKYAELPAENRPWRVTWYMTGPYFAYYYTGRYYDVIALADKTINSASEPYIEENWYWRARAKAALGDTSGAIDDLRRSLQYHPGFSPSVQFLAQLGVSE